MKRLVTGRTSTYVPYLRPVRAVQPFCRVAQDHDDLGQPFLAVRCCHEQREVQLVVSHTRVSSNLRSTGMRGIVDAETSSLMTGVGV